MNGIRRNVPKLVTSSAIDCDHLLLALAAGDVVLGRVELVLADARVDERPAAVHRAAPPCEPPAGPAVALGRRSRRGSRTCWRGSASARRSSRLRACRSRSWNLAKSTTTTWLTGTPVSASTVLIASVGPPYAYAALTLSGAAARGCRRGGRAGSERKAIRCSSGSVRTSMIASERNGALALRPFVRTEDEDRRRVREHEPVLRRERRVGARVEALVGLLDAASEGEVAEQRPDDGREHGDEEDDEPDAQPAPRPAAPARLRPRVRIATVGRPRGGGLPLRLGRDRAFGPPATVDPVRLVLGRHGDRVS